MNKFRDNLIDFMLINGITIKRNANRHERQTEHVDHKQFVFMVSAFK